MRLLVLGGTLFLGRHVVDAALVRGHEATVFTRGQRPNPWPGRVQQLIGDRDPALGEGLAALGDGSWDAVIDTSGYLPRCVRASAALLADRVGSYLFVSSLSVYARATRPGIGEDAPVATLEDPASEAIARDYGALKAACEAAVASELDGAACIVRPGLIVGPHDPTDRFAYWVARFRAPALLGDRPARAVVPGPPERPIQMIDARDLAAWMLDLVERRADGVYNACSRAGQWTMGDLVDALVVPEAPRPAWVHDDTLVARGVVPWTGLPLWLPQGDAEHAGFMSFSCERACASGLQLRSLRETVDDTAAWLNAREGGDAFANVLDAASERGILETLPYAAGATP